MDQAYVITDSDRYNHIDPRVKLFHTFLAGAMLFVTRSNSGVFLTVAFMFCILQFLGLRKDACHMVFLSVMFYVLVQFFNHLGGRLAPMLGMTLYFFFKFTPVMGIYCMMTRSISASELVNALERMKLPRSVTITLAVTFRFMPTIGVEMRTIRESMRIRNIPLTFWNVIRAPLSMMEYVLVPMMMRFVKVGEELAAAAVVRCMEHPGKRGSLIEIRIGIKDVIYMLVIIAFSIFMVWFEGRI